MVPRPGVWGLTTQVLALRVGVHGVGQGPFAGQAEAPGVSFLPAGDWGSVVLRGWVSGDICQGPCSHLRVACSPSPGLRVLFVFPKEVVPTQLQIQVSWEEVFTTLYGAISS